MKWSDISLCNDQYEYSIRVNQGVIRPNDVSTLHAYCVLRDAFGSPNNSDFDDSKTQWSYYFQVPGAHIDIHDWKLESWSIVIYEDGAVDVGKEYSDLMAQGATSKELESAMYTLLSNKDRTNALKIGNEFLALMKQRIPKITGQAKNLSSQALSTILQNPFFTYYEDAVKLLKIARETQFNTTTHYCKSAFFLFMAAFEGLMNLVYELYTKPDLRDERLFERLSREQIDVKIRLAPLYCVCFSVAVIDSNSDAFRLFQSIINLRNDFIHANLTKPMKRPVVIEDGHTFIVDQYDIDKSGLPKNIDELTPEHIGIVQSAIDQMVELIAASMRPKYRREFKKIILEDYIATGAKVVKRG